MTDSWEHIKTAMCQGARALAEAVRDAGEVSEEAAAEQLGVEVEGRGGCVRHLAYLVNLAVWQATPLIELVDLSADLDTDHWLLRWVGPTAPEQRPLARPARRASQLELF